MLEPGVILNLELGAKDPAELRAASQEYAAAASKAGQQGGAPGSATGSA